jgi:hypothetical protein
MSVKTTKQGISIIDKIFEEYINRLLENVRRNKNDAKSGRNEKGHIDKKD